MRSTGSSFKTEHLVIVLIPLLAAAYPLARILPQIHQWWMQHHPFKIYGDLKLLESELERRGPGESTDDLLSALDRLQKRASKMFVTVSFAQRRFSCSLSRGCPSRASDREYLICYAVCDPA